MSNRRAGMAPARARGFLSRWRARVRPAVGLAIAAVGILIAVVVATGRVHAILHWVRVHLLASGGTAAAAAVLAAMLTLYQLRQSPRAAADAAKANMLRLLRRHCWGVDGKAGRLPKVSELTDPVELGVHPAADIDTPCEGEPGLPRNVPVYIPRDIDAELHAAIARGGLVLVEGDSTAGKTRAAYEAMRRMPGDTSVLVPTELESLQELVDNGLLDPATLKTLGIKLGDLVIWLDDLERYLGMNGLTVRLLHSLTSSSADNVVLLATMRASEYLTRLATPRQGLVGPGYHPLHAERDLLRQARVVSMERRFSSAECERAVKEAYDPRIKDALTHKEEYGLAKYMAAGPKLLHLWQLARAVDNPDAVRVGAAIVAAALDCRRAGLTKPAPVSLLRTLYPSYVERPRAPQLDPRTFDAGLSWATEPVQATSALLTATDDGYEAFDYLLDKLQTDPATNAVRDVVWTALLAGLQPPDAWAIGAAAYWANRLAFAEQAFRVGLRSDNESVVERSAQGMSDLARLLDQYREADQWAWRAEHPETLPKDADQRSRFGTRLESASEDWFRHIAEADGDRTRRLIIDYEHTSLRFDGENYHYRKVMESLTNRSPAVIDRYPFHIAVDRYPGDPVRSEQQYRRYPLAVEDVGLRAWHGAGPMDWEVEFDSPSFKDLWLLFRNQDAMFPLLPGESCSIAYEYTISDKHWGPWLKRKVRIPTRRLSSEISFPASLAAELTGSEVIPSAAPTPLNLTERQDGDQTVFIWEVTDPPLNAQYFFEWRFRQSPEPTAASSDAARKVGE